MRMLPWVMARPIALRHARRIATRYLGGNVRRVGSFLVLDVPRSVTLGAAPGSDRVRVLRGDAAELLRCSSDGGGAVEHTRCTRRGEGSCSGAPIGAAFDRTRRTGISYDALSRNAARNPTRARRRRVDGWLLYDFRGLNPDRRRLLRLEGMTSRRTFAFIPRDGVPVALTHAIEQGPWRHWPRDWRKEIYRSWRSLEALLAKHVAGKRVAMEYSAGDAVPYLDRIPAGVLEMVRPPARRWCRRASWCRVSTPRGTPTQIASHDRAAEDDRGDRAGGDALAGERARATSPIAEHELMAWIRERFTKARAVHRPRAERLRGRERGESALRAVARRSRASFATATSC